MRHKNMSEQPRRCRECYTSRQSLALQASRVGLAVSLLLIKESQAVWKSSRGLLHLFYEKREGVEGFAREGSHLALRERLIPLHQLGLQGVRMNQRLGTCG
jgi:hypothetical protein